VHSVGQQLRRRPAGVVAAGQELGHPGVLIRPVTAGVGQSNTNDSVICRSTEKNNLTGAGWYASRIVCSWLSTACWVPRSDPDPGSAP